jgi:hypothetical protein
VQPSRLLAPGKSLALAAALEVIMGLVLIVHPPAPVRLLFGAELSGAGVALGRLAGIGLLSLGLACWPGPGTTGGLRSALRGMLTYNVLATAYLGYLGVAGEWVGPFLFPAVAIHAVMTLLLARAWREGRRYGFSMEEE